MRSGRGLQRGIVCWCALASVSACAVGPNYHRPSAQLPGAWTSEEPWHAAAPNDAALKGDWWELFDDEILDSLVQRSLQNNQTLKVAAARLDQARSQVTVAKSYLYPDVGFGASAARAKVSANRPLSAYSTPNESTVQNDFKLGPSAARGRRLSSGR
jgi:multidrug efflux system outer membrane protein